MISPVVDVGPVCRESATVITFISCRSSTCIRQHPSASVSIRQHTFIFCRSSTCIRQHTSANVSIRQHTSAHVSIRQHTSAYVSIRQHTSAYEDKAHLSLSYTFLYVGSFATARVPLSNISGGWLNLHVSPNLHPPVFMKKEQFSAPGGSVRPKRFS
jgi:hypothetical protein